MKIIIIVLLVLLILFIGLMLFFKSFYKMNNKELVPREEIIIGQSDKKALILYQKSRHETAYNIAKQAREELYKNGYTVITNYPSSMCNYDVNKFDIVILGSCVYMGMLSENLFKFLEKSKIVNKKIIIFSGGSDDTKLTEFDKLLSIINKSNIVKTVKIVNGNYEKINQVIDELI